MQFQRDSEKATLILEQIDKAALKFRAKPRDEYMKATAIHLLEKGLLISQIQTIFDKSISEHDHFPSIAQIEAICSKLGITGVKEDAFNPNQVSSCKNCNGHGYFLCEDAMGYILTTKCNCLKGSTLQLPDEQTAFSKGYTKVKKLS